MPAIRPAHLKTQVDQLAKLVSNPTGFVGALKDILDNYSDRTRKPGFVSPQPSLIPSFKVPKQVTRQIKARLKSDISADSRIALPIADLLWQENWLELKVLALEILGWIPSYPSEVIINRLKLWSDQRVEDRVLDSEFSKGLVGLSKEDPESIYTILESWLKSPEKKEKNLGMRIIPKLIQDQEFDSLPTIFRLLQPFVVQVGNIPDPDLLCSIRGLAHRSPNETSYFLQRTLSVSDNKLIKGLIRQIMDAFPVEEKQNMQSFLNRFNDGF